MPSPLFAVHVENSVTKQLLKYVGEIGRLDIVIEVCAQNILLQSKHNRTVACRGVETGTLFQQTPHTWHVSVMIIWNESEEPKKAHSSLFVIAKQ